MKTKHKIIFAALLAVITGAALFVACNKDETIKEELTHEKSIFTGNNGSKVQIGGSITIHMNFHRVIEERPRDGKRCACEACFGICIYEIEIYSDGYYHRGFDEYNSKMDFDFKNLTATLYVFEQLRHAESEFGVDEPLFIPASYFSDEVIKNYSIKRGVTILPKEYTYEAKRETVAIDSRTSRESFGKVEVNIKID